MPLCFPLAESVVFTLLEFFTIGHQWDVRIAVCGPYCCMCAYFGAGGCTSVYICGLYSGYCSQSFFISGLDRLASKPWVSFCFCLPSVWAKSPVTRLRFRHVCSWNKDHLRQPQAYHWCTLWIHLYIYPLVSFKNPVSLPERTAMSLFYRWDRWSGLPMIHSYLISTQRCPSPLIFRMR